MEISLLDRPYITSQCWLAKLGATGSQPDNHQSLINELDVDIFINDIDPNFSVNVETRATENSRFES